MAFEAVDIDDSGKIDQSELMETMEEVAKHLNLAAPNKDEIEGFMAQFDQNDDDMVDKDEFEYLVIMTLERMAERELETNLKIQKEVRQEQWYTDVYFNL